MGQCINCGKLLDEVFVGSATRHQFNDALHIQLHLGYAEFLDHEPNQHPSPQGNFCRSCVLDLIALFPGIRKMLKPDYIS